MRAPSSVIAAASLVLALPAAAGEDWPRSPSAAVSGDFAVVQFATAEPEAAVAAWRKPTAGVRLARTHRVRMGQPLASFISFRNCRADNRGHCQVTTDWALLGPHGKIVLRAHTVVIADAPPLRPGMVGLSRDSASITFAPPDPPGIYVLRALTTDHVAGKSLRTQDSITVRP